MSKDKYTPLDKCCQCSASLIAVDQRMIYCVHHDYCLEWDDDENVIFSNGGRSCAECDGPFKYKKQTM